MNQPPKVSVVVPVYKVEKYLSQCLDSVVNQTYQNLEILVVDDCSPDASLAIIQSYMSKDSRITLLRHEKNLGIGGARNSGIKAASGKWILFLDSDDYIDQNCLQESIEELEQANADLVLFGTCGFDDISGAPVPFPFLNTRLEKPTRIDNSNLRAIGSVIWNKIFRLKDLHENQIRFAEKVKHEDEEFWIKYVACVEPIAVSVAKQFHHYRQRKDSITGGAIYSKVDLPLALSNCIAFLMEKQKYTQYRGVIVQKANAYAFIYYELHHSVREEFLRRLSEVVKKLHLNSIDMETLSIELKLINLLGGKNLLILEAMLWLIELKQRITKKFSI